MEQEEFDRTVEMLTPKFRKKSDFVFGRRREKTRRNMWWHICSAAAVIALIVILGGNQFLTKVSAETIVKQSFKEFNTANTYKVKFYITGELWDKGIKPVPGGKEIHGTLYVVNKDGNEMDRVEIESPEQFVEIYDGKTYRRYKNGTLVKNVKSESIKLLDMFKLSTAQGLNDTSITERGDSIILSHKKGDVVMYGIFSRKTNGLNEAYVTYDNERLLGTESIEYGIEIPDKMFE